MKKWIVLILVLDCVLGLTGCEKTTGSEDPITGGVDMPNTKNDIVIESEQTQQAVTDDEKYDLIPMFGTGYGYQMKYVYLLNDGG